MTSDQDSTATPTGPDAPVGRVRLDDEEPQWEEQPAAEERTRWTPQAILLAAAVILGMVALLAFILWGAFQQGPA